MDQLKGQLEGAQWNLDKTVVKAPADGYVTNLALRKGARVANLPLAPVMAFIDTANTIIGVEINQIDARYVAPGQEVETHLQVRAGHIYAGRVESVLQAVATGQVTDVGHGSDAQGARSRSLCCPRELDDDEFARKLPAGSTGSAAIYTGHLKPTHMVRARVAAAGRAIINYVNPF